MAFAMGAESSDTLGSSLTLLFHPTDRLKLKGKKGSSVIVMAIPDWIFFFKFQSYYSLSVKLFLKNKNRRKKCFVFLSEFKERGWPCPAMMERPEGALLSPFNFYTSRALGHFSFCYVNEYANGPMALSCSHTQRDGPGRPIWLGKSLFGNEWTDIGARSLHLNIPIASMAGPFNRKYLCTFYIIQREEEEEEKKKERCRPFLGRPLI